MPEPKPQTFQSIKKYQKNIKQIQVIQAWWKGIYIRNQISKLKNEYKTLLLESLKEEDPDCEYYIEMGNGWNQWWKVPEYGIVSDKEEEKGDIIEVNELEKDTASLIEENIIEEPLQNQNADNITLEATKSLEKEESNNEEPLLNHDIETIETELENPKEKGEEKIIEETLSNDKEDISAYETNALDDKEELAHSISETKNEASNQNETTDEDLYKNLSLSELNFLLEKYIKDREWILSKIKERYEMLCSC